MTTNEYLDLVQESLIIESDYALAKALGVTRGAIYNYRNGLSTMNPKVAIKIAIVLNLHPAMLLAHASAERADTPEEAAIWDEVAQKFAPPLFVQNALKKRLASA